MEKNIFFEGLPIYFINLNRSKDRLSKLAKSLKQYGIKDFKRIEGVDGKHHNLSALQSSHQHPLINSEIAIIYSFLKLIKEFVENEKSDYILMCDDDIDFYNSTKMNFNFYETLEYHNPKLYNLKVVTLDLLNEYPANKLFKAKEISYGQATIINKLWAKEFLNKYGLLNKEIDISKPIDLRGYEQNVYGSRPKAIHPAADAINFDENTYIWRVFSCFPYETSLTKPDTQYVDDAYRLVSKAVVKQLTSNSSPITIDAFKEK